MAKVEEFASLAESIKTSLAENLHSSTTVGWEELPEVNIQVTKNPEFSASFCTAGVGKI
jgi:hypothetical protein